jgi:hypothetical protein
MSEDLLALTAQIVSAHVRRTRLRSGIFPRSSVTSSERYRDWAGRSRAGDGGGEAGGARRPIGLRFAHHLHGVREEDDHVETSSDDRAWPDDRSIPDKVQFARHLSDGGAGLCQDALFTRQGNGIGKSRSAAPKKAARRK